MIPQFDNVFILAVSRVKLQIAKLLVHTGMAGGGEWLTAVHSLKQLDVVHCRGGEITAERIVIHRIGWIE